MLLLVGTPDLVRYLALEDIQDSALFQGSPDTLPLADTQALGQSLAKHTRVSDRSLGNILASGPCPVLAEATPDWAQFPVNAVN